MYQYDIMNHNENFREFMCKIENSMVFRIYASIMPHNDTIIEHWIDSHLYYIKSQFCNVGDVDEDCYIYIFSNLAISRKASYGIATS
jgi:hypothetical protein